MLCCTRRPHGYIISSASGVRNRAGRGTKVAHKCAGLAHKACRLGVSPTLLNGGQKHKRPTSGPIGHIIPATWSVPNVPQREAKSQVAHKWAG